MDWRDPCVFELLVVLLQSSFARFCYPNFLLLIVIIKSDIVGK